MQGEPSRRKSRRKTNVRRPVRSDEPVYGARAHTEILDSSVEVVSMYNCLRGNLEDCFLAVSAEFAFVLRHYDKALNAVLATCRIGEQGLAREIAAATLSSEPLKKVLHASLKDDYKSEDFLLAGEGPQSVAGYQINNVGAVKLNPGSYVALFINRRVGQTDRPTSSDYGPSWDTTRLKELRAGLYVSSLKLGDALYEMQFRGLVVEHPGRWVAYHADRQIGIFDSDEEAVRACLAQEVPPLEIYIQLIEEAPPASFGLNAYERN